MTGITDTIATRAHPSPSASRPRWLVATTEYAGTMEYTGGIGRHYAALLPALVRHGIDVDLAVFPDADPATGRGADEPNPAGSGDSILPGGVRLVAWHPTGRLPRTRVVSHRARVLRRVFAREQYDTVFAPEWAGIASALPRTAPLVTNLATGARLAAEVSGQGLRDLPISSRLPVAMQMAAEARQLRRSTGLIAISTAMLDRVNGMFDRLPPARVVRNCIDVDAVRASSASAPAPAGWPQGEDPVVLFLGRSERRKGVTDAVAAFVRVTAEHPRARLVLAGAGGDARFEPRRDDLVASLPAASRDRVTWLGHVPGDELYGAIARADVTICPSRWEGFGNAALEVKAIGTPLVVTSGSGFDDFCTDGYDCQSVPPADPARLAAAISIALSRPGWARTLAEHARRQVRDFAPDPVAADLIAATRELLAPARPARPTA